MNQPVRQAQSEKGFSQVILLGIVAILVMVGAGGFLVLREKKMSSFERKVQREVSPQKVEYFSYFPARLEDFAVPPKMYGLWPYGIKGNNKDSHNEGHPGWDLELKKGSKVYAVGDLVISQIHEGDKQAEGLNIQVIEAGMILNGQQIDLVYHSVINLEPGVKERARIPAGAPLAEVGYPLSDNSAMIHFGVFAPKDRVGVCPTRYFSKSAQEILAKVVAQSRDLYTGQPYSSACVGKINRAIYEQNFPERLRFLEGGEEWE